MTTDTMTCAQDFIHALILNQPSRFYLFHDYEFDAKEYAKR